MIDEVQINLKDFFARKLQLRRDKMALKEVEDNTTAEEFFTQYHTEKEIQNEEEGPEAGGVSTGQAEDEEEEQAKKTDPFYQVKRQNAKHFDLLVQILAKCQHYTATKNINGRILVLEIIAHGSFEFCEPATKCLNSKRIFFF